MPITSRKIFIVPTCTLETLAIVHMVNQLGY